MQNSQFQFDKDSFVFNGYETLKSKLREPTVHKPKHVFVGGRNGLIEQYEIVCNPETQELEDLVCVKTFNKHANVFGSLLFDKQENKLIGSNIVDSRVRSKKVAWFGMLIKKKEKYLITVVGDIDIEIWDWKTEQVFKTLKGHTGTIQYLLVNEEDEELLTCHVGGTIKLWCLKTFVHKKTFSDYYSSPLVVCLLDYNKDLFAVGDYCGKIKIWNKRTGLCAHTMTYPFEVTEALVYSSELGLIISCGSGGRNNVNAWTPQLDLNFRVENPFGKLCSKLQFLQSQTQVIVGDVRGNLFIVDLVSQKVIWKKETCLGRITSILVQ